MKTAIKQTASFKRNRSSLADGRGMTRSVSKGESFRPPPAERSRETPVGWHLVLGAQALTAAVR